MMTILEGTNLTPENIKAACRNPVKVNTKKGVKRELWIDRFATVNGTDGISRKFRFFVEKMIVWAEQLGIVRFPVTDEELARWEKVEFSPTIAIEGE